MRKTVWKIIVLIMVLMMSGPSAFSASISTGVNLTETFSMTEQDGEKVFSTRYLTQNFNLNLNRPVTPIISYNFNLRSSRSDSEAVDYLADKTTITYNRRVDPTLELFVRNNIYDLNAGYRRQEQWSTAHYVNEGRQTSEFYYSRFSIMPNKLPSISLDLERMKSFDYLHESEIRNSTNSYSLSSSYTLPSKDLVLGYNIAVSRDVNRTPLSILVKSVSANFSSNYNIGYSGFLWNRKIDYSAMYRGNFSRNRVTQDFTATGSQLNIRGNNGGSSALNSDKQVALFGKPVLTDGNLITSAGIDLSSKINNQIGVQILFGKSVDRLYIYVDKDISSESALSLRDQSNWQVYKSSSNSYGSWTAVNINSVDVVYDTLNNKYRYEILFTTSQEAFYFKVVNLGISSVSGVAVTEIQALGTDAVTSIGAVTDVSKSLSQGFNLNARIRPAKKLDFNLGYSMDRADRTPASVNANDNVSSTLTNNYAASARWQAHSLLTSVMNLSRSESFNNTGGPDSASNSYSLTTNYIPFSAIDINLTILRNDSFSDSSKIFTNDAVLISADTKLNRDVNMVTDLGFSKSNSLDEGITTSSSTINGSLDARITRKMAGAFNYGYRTTTSGGDSAVSKDLSTSVNYQVGRLTSLSVNLDYGITESSEDISGLVGMNWLPLPKIRLNMNYEYSESVGDLNKTVTNSASGYGTIYLTKFANVQVVYDYMLKDQGGSTLATHNINTNLNCRF